MKFVKTFVLAVTMRMQYAMPIAIKMFLKPVWAGKIHGVEVYATHVVRIW